MKASKTNGDIQILRNAMLFGLTRRAWSNRCMASREHIKTEETDELGQKTDRKLSKRVNATKQLIQCEEYDNIMAHLNGTYTWVLARSMLATGIGRGINFVRRDTVDVVIDKVEADRKVLRGELVPAFLAAYPEAKNRAKRPVDEASPDEGGLGSLYCEADYPTGEQLAASFDIIYRIFALSVPDELPEEIRARENQKLKDTFAAAQTDLVYGLRAGLQVIVEHAIERLHVKTGEKAKVFVADSLIGNFFEFFETFRFKNLMDDADLEKVVDDAKEIVAQFAPNIQAVKNSVPLRNQIAADLGTVKATLDNLLKDRPTRKFDFNE